MTRNVWLLTTAMVSPLLMSGCLRTLTQPPPMKIPVVEKPAAKRQKSASSADSPYSPMELVQTPQQLDKPQAALVSQQSSAEKPTPILKLPAPKLPAPKTDVGPRKVIPKMQAPPQLPDLTVEPSPPNEATKSVKAEKPAKTEPPPEPVLEALRMILNDRHQDALRHLKNYDEPTQELFLRLLPPLAMISRKSLEKLSQQEVAVLNDQLENLLAALRPRTDLIVNQMCCCEWIKSYGVYKPLPKDHLFHSGNASRPGELVQVYVQLRNLHSIRRGKFFETRLSSEVEIRDASGKIVWRYAFNDDQQPLQTRTALHDYFNNYSFYVPASLAPGSYTLTIRVADLTRPEHRRVAEKSIPFRVTGLSMR